MNLIVKLLQYLIVLIMIYPIYYLYETDKIKTACQQIKPSMLYNDIVMNLTRDGLSFSIISGDYSQGEKWWALVESRASFAGYACEIRGSGNQVAGARIIKGKQIAP